MLRAAALLGLALMTPCAWAQAPSASSSPSASTSASAPATSLPSAPSEQDASGDWPMAAHDHANTRYSPLAQITPENVARLQPVLEPLHLLLATVLALAGGGRAGAASPALRVCADPDNLPYSHRDGSGYENRLAQWLAEDLHRPLQVTWVPLQRGFVRKTLGEGRCDVLLGVPAGLERVATTRPYYRSGYVFLSRPLDGQPLRGFDDARLRALRIGVQLPGDGAATPPGQVLAQRGAVERVRGFEPLGEEPSARALAGGEIDAAVLWGPPAAYFARRAGAPLVLTPVRGAVAGALSPFAFDMALAVRPQDEALRAALDAALQRLQPRIDALLAQYGVPLLPPEPEQAQEGLR